jgi:hypothetical protein
MAASDERAEEEDARLRAHPVMQDARHLREQLRELAAAVAVTGNGVAATYHSLAEQALRQGRLDDARRLAGEVAAALRSVEQEEREAVRWVPPATALDREDEAAGRRVAEARRIREQAADRRDELARVRDEASRQRDEIATERDRRADSRAVAADRRNTAAAERDDAQERWVKRLANSTGGGAAQEEQALVDEEMEATYRRQSAEDRARDTGDRADAARDREALRQDRLTAGRDRESAEADRESAARDRAAAETDRAQAEIRRRTAR